MGKVKRVSEVPIKDLEKRGEFFIDGEFIVFPDEFMIREVVSISQRERKC